MKVASGHILFIDYLRGVAIISVFLYHCIYAAYGMFGLPWQWLHRGFTAPASFIALLPVHFGFLGVPMFFVISGFCIHLSFQQQGKEWVSFFIRRFFRLYPAYLAILLLFLLLYAHNFQEFWFQFKYHALLIHNFNPGTENAVNGSALEHRGRSPIVFDLSRSLMARCKIWMEKNFNRIGGMRNFFGSMGRCSLSNNGLFRLHFSFFAFESFAHRGPLCHPVSPGFLVQLVAGSLRRRCFPAGASTPAG
jgi:hypothetical protein